MNKINKSILGHVYYPDRLGEGWEGEVFEISPKNAIRIWYFSGQKRWYKPSVFRNSFVHSKDCYMCEDNTASD